MVTDRYRIWIIKIFVLYLPSMDLQKHHTLKSRGLGQGCGFFATRTLCGWTRCFAAHLSTTFTITITTVTTGTGTPVGVE